MTQRAAKDQIESLINEPVYEIDINLWEQIRKPYTAELNQIKENCERVLDESFECDYDETYDFISTLEEAIYNYTTEYIRRLFKDINTNLLRKFNKLFKKDEQGRNREWMKIEEHKIRELHAKCKAEMDDVINEFKYIKLPRTTSATTGSETDGKPTSTT